MSPKALRESLANCSAAARALAVASATIDGLSWLSHHHLWLRRSDHDSLLDDEAWPATLARKAVGKGVGYFQSLQLHRGSVNAVAKPMANKQSPERNAEGEYEGREHRTIG
jgi:hypothetical protein